MNKILTFALVAALCGNCAVAVAQEAAWPTKPIRAIIPFAAGSAADVIARVVADPLSKRLGQPIIVENRPGAGGTVASSLVAHAPPDGYTILIHSNSHTVSKFIYKNLDFDPERDLVGVTALVSISQMFVTSPEKGYKNLGDLVRAGKAKPGSINYASAGTGSSTHLGGERLRIAGDFPAQHIPMKSTAEALTEVLAGRVDYTFGPFALYAPQIKSGKLVPLAVADFKRSPAFPDVPTTAESGLKDAEYPAWAGMYVPPKTPRAIIDKLNAETIAVLKMPEVQARLEGLYLVALPMSSADFAVFLEKDFRLSESLVKAAGLRATE